MSGLPGRNLAGLVLGLLLLAGCERQEGVTFVGDSITAAGQWHEAFPHLPVSNKGVPGDQSSYVLDRLEDVMATRARQYVLMVGINDLLQGQPPEQVAGRVALIRERLRASAFPPPRVVVLSTLQCRPLPAADPPNLCSARVRAGVAALNQRLRQQTPQADFLDLNPVMSPGGQLRREFTTDGVHLTPAGYGQWQALLKPLLNGPGALGVRFPFWQLPEGTRPPKTAGEHSL